MYSVPSFPNVLCYKTRRERTCVHSCFPTIPRLRLPFLLLYSLSSSFPSFFLPFFPLLLSPNHPFQSFQWTNFSRPVLPYHLYKVTYLVSLPAGLSRAGATWKNSSAFSFRRSTITEYPLQSKTIISFISSCMAQTSRPRPRVGLPSSPAPRSRSLSARVPSQDLPPRPSSAASQRSRTFTATTSNAPPVPHLPHNLKPQRSFADIPSAWNANIAPRQPEVRRIARVPPPPLPVEKSTVPDDDGNLTSEFGRKGSVSSLASSASTSSRASATSSSSSSSFFGTKSPLSAASSTTSLEDDAYVPKRDPPPIPSKPTPGFGTALWNRVAVVAENLTVSVSKAIETNIATYSGEGT